jgi:hypothetical protein
MQSKEKQGNTLARVVPLTALLEWISGMFVLLVGFWR